MCCVYQSCDLYSALWWLIERCTQDTTTGYFSWSGICGPGRVTYFFILSTGIPNAQKVKAESPPEKKVAVPLVIYGARSQ